MKSTIFTLLALTGLLFCGSHLSAQIHSDYYDPAQFHTLRAELRSEDGRARVIIHEGDPLLQILTSDGELASPTMDFGRTWPLGLHSIKTKDGQTLYLYFWSESHHDWPTDNVAAFRVNRNGNLEEAPAFKTSKALLKSINCGWQHEDVEYCHAMTVEDELYPGISYDAKTASVYVPLVEKAKDGKQRYTNRFLVYQFDGNVFAYKGRQAARWLHASLKDYQNTEYCFETDNYLIQVDKLNDGSYRYAAWKNGSTLSDMKRKPDLIVNKGTVKNNCYTFKNKTYTYVIDLNGRTLVVKNNGKTILREHIYG